MGKTKGVSDYKRCDDCDILIPRKIWRRHRLLHHSSTSELLSRNARLPHQHGGDKLPSDASRSNLTERAIIRSVARRLYVLENLGIPHYAQIEALHSEFPTLTAHTRQVCQTAIKTVIDMVKCEIRTALPHMSAKRLNIKTSASARRMSPAAQLTTVTSQTVTVHESSSKTQTSAAHESCLIDEIPAPEIQLLDTDINENLVEAEPPLTFKHLKDAREKSVVPPGAEVMDNGEVRIATTKYVRKKRTRNDMHLSDQQTMLSLQSQLTNMEKADIAPLHTSATKTCEVQTVETTQRLRPAVMVTTPTEGDLENLSSIPTGSSLRAERSAQTVEDGRHVVLSPFMPTSTTLWSADQRSQHSSRESSARSLDSEPIRSSLTRRGRGRGRSNRHRRGNCKPDRDWRPRTTSTTPRYEMHKYEMETFKREMLEEMRRMLMLNKSSSTNNSTTARDRQ